jgi:excisionase family DNA binding protein
LRLHHIKELAMELLTVKETANLLRVSPITIRRYIASGRLPAERVGRGIRVRRKAIEELVTPVVVPGESRGPTDWSRKPPEYADEDMAEIWSPSTPGEVAWVPIDRLDEYLDEASDGDELPLRNIIDLGRSNGSADAMNDGYESLPGIVESETDSSGDIEDDAAKKLPTVLKALGISVGIFRTGQPTNIAEHKDDYLAEAFEFKG